LLSTQGYPLSANACLFKLGSAFYDFTPFKLAQNVWPATFAGVYQYEFGFCLLMSEAANATCANDAYAIGSTLSPDVIEPPTDCVSYSAADKESIQAETITRTGPTGDLQTGVSITYMNGDACILTGGPTSFKINSWCNPDIAASDTIYSYIALGDQCNPYVEIESSIGGCDLISNSPIWAYLDKAEPYFGIVGIVVGFIVCFYGLKLLKPCLFLGGLLSCMAAGLLFCYLIYASSIDDFTSTFYYFLGGGFVIGVIVGWLLARFVKVGAAVLAGWGGFCLGIILNEAFLFRFEYKWVFWASIIVCIIGAALLTFKLFELSIVLSTAFLGAYLMVRGVSCYAGHYYNEFTMVKLLQAGAFDQIDPFYWCYVGGFVIFGGIGIFIQWKYRPQEKKTHPYHS
jgi:hypothetical protein